MCRTRLKPPPRGSNASILGFALASGPVGSDYWLLAEAARHSKARQRDAGGERGNTGHGGKPAPVARRPHHRRHRPEQRSRPGRERQRAVRAHRHLPRPAGGREPVPQTGACGGDGRLDHRLGQRSLRQAHRRRRHRPGGGDRGRRHSARPPRALVRPRRRARRTADNPGAGRGGERRVGCPGDHRRRAVTGPQGFRRPAIRCASCPWTATPSP